MIRRWQGGGQPRLPDVLRSVAVTLVRAVALIVTGVVVAFVGIVLFAILLAGGLGDHF